MKETSENKGINANPADLLCRHSHTAAFLIPLLLMTAFFAVLRITPFGDNTFLYDDLRRQYIEFYAYLQAILRGQASMFYFPGKSLGGSVLSLFMTHLSSPLNLVFAIFPVESFPEVLTFLIILRFALLSLTSDIFLKSIGLEKTVPFSVSFSLCLWVFANLINPMWMDAVIWFPLFMTAALKLSQKPDSIKAFIILTLTVSFQLYLQYYLCFMMCIFLAFFMVLRTVLKKTSPCGLLIVFLSALSGLLLMSPVMFPALIDLMASEKNLGDTPLIERLIENPAFIEPAKVISKMFSFAIDGDQVMFGMPHLFCGTIMIPLSVLFYVRKDIPLKDKLECLFLSALLLFSFCFTPFDLIWHVGNAPNGYPFRYAFLFAAVMVVCGAKAWNAGPPSIRELRIAFAFTAFLNIIILIRSMLAPGIPWYSLKKALAGLAILGLEYLFISFMSGNRGIGDRCVAAILLLLLCLSDLTANQQSIIKASYMPSQKASEYREKYRRKKAMTDEIKASDPGFYRIEDICSDTYDSLNDSMVFGYRGVSHYSTGDHRSVRLFLKALGFNYNGLNDVYTAENTDTCDSILTIKHLLTEDGIYDNKYIFPSAVRTTELLPEEMKEDSPFELQEEIAAVLSGASLFSGSEKTVSSASDTVHNTVSEKNESAPFDTALNTVSEKNESAPSDTALNTVSEKNEPTSSGDSSLESDNEINIGNDKRLFIPVYIILEQLHNGDDSQTLIKEIEIKTKEKGHLYFYIKGLKNTAQNMTVSIDGQVISGYANASAIKIIDLGEYDKGSEHTVSLTVLGDPEKADFGEPVMVTENMAVLTSMTERSSRNALNVTEVSPVELLIENRNAGSFFLSVPYEEGFKAFNSNTGHEYEIRPAFGALTQINATEDGDVILKYKVPGTKPGSLLMLLGAAIVFLVNFLRWQKGRRSPRQS